MGGFLGIGKSSSAKALEAQRQRETEESLRLEKEKKIRQAERIAKKGQESAKIQLGSEVIEEEEPVTSTKSSSPSSTVGASLGLGGLGGKSGKKTTGVQL